MADPVPAERSGHAITERTRSLSVNENVTAGSLV
jgi:hypothetical protein